jgi:hypothetical protein
VKALSPLRLLYLSVGARALRRARAQVELAEARGAG